MTASPVPLELAYRDHLIIISALAKMSAANPDSVYGEVHDRMVGKLEAVLEVSPMIELSQATLLPGSNYTVYCYSPALNDKKIEAIKEVRTMTGMSLKDAKDFIDSASVSTVPYTDDALRSVEGSCLQASRNNLLMCHMIWHVKKVA